MGEIYVSVAVRTGNFHIYEANPRSNWRGILLTVTLELFKIQQNKSFFFLIQLYVIFAVISLYVNFFHNLNGKSVLVYSVFISLSCASVTVSPWVEGDEISEQC